MANPILDPRNFESGREYVEETAFGGFEAMSVNGTLQITGFLGLILLSFAAFTWSRFSLGYTDMGVMLTGAGAIIGFVLALIISFSRLSTSFGYIKYLVPFYAACEGLFLGGVSASFEASYPGVVSTAVAGTFAALFAMLILYRLRIINCTQTFRSVIFIATLSICGVYLIDFIGHFFGHSISVIHSSTPMGLLFSAVVVVIAAFNLIIDFDFIEQAVMRRFPKEFEWYCSFGLMVTIVWMYVEILRLVAKLQRR